MGKKVNIIRQKDRKSDDRKTGNDVRIRMLAINEKLSR